MAVDHEVDHDNGLIDIRSGWEISRLQRITKVITCNSNDAAAKIDLFRWIKDNPFLHGANYVSPMECGLRIPAFFYCLKHFKGLSPEQRNVLVRTIYEHAWWISRRLSLYSSLGNHTIAESVGLVFAGAVFYNSNKGKEWLSRGFNLLKSELTHQVLDDGGPAEQSLSYHRFVLDLYWLAIDFLEKNGFQSCEAFKPRLILAEKFLGAFRQQDRRLPSIGDSDDGHAIAPGLSPKRPRANGTKEGALTFPASGYTIIRLPGGTCLIFDHGPLGMAPLYNHGHSDALSILLCRNGQDMFIDPGTYRYNGVPKWRRYFKGSRAHNTVTIDGADQAIQETSFIWSHPYRSKLLHFSNEGNRLFIKATHDGYSRLKQPVYHERTLVILNDNTFLIKDTFSGRGIHSYELNYHLHPQASLDWDADWWTIANKRERVFIKLLNQLTFTAVSGQEDPILGWYSPSYGKKEKTTVLTCSQKGEPGAISFTTVICIQELSSLEFVKEGLFL